MLLSQFLTIEHFLLCRAYTRNLIGINEKSFKAFLNTYRYIEQQI